MAVVAGNRWGRPSAERRGRRLKLENLEPRMLLAAEPLITEFVADNNNSLLDGDGNPSDWIELYNAGDTTADLTDWYLTDTPADLNKWPFPATTLTAGQYQIVFASAPEDGGGNVLDNYVDAGGFLHTNFRLGAGGEYLALVYDDGVNPPTIASEFGPAGVDYPQQQEDVSYGLAEAVDTTTLVAAGDEANVLIPDAAADADYGDNWTGGDEAAFLTAGGLAGWTSGTGTGVGFDTVEFDPGGPADTGNVALGKPVTASESLANDRVVKDAQINEATGAANLDAAAFTFYSTPTDSSLTLLARDVPGRQGTVGQPDDLLFFNGLVVRQVDASPGLTRVAAFDVNDSANAAATQAGFTPLEDGADTGVVSFSGADGLVTLEVTNSAANDRDRGVAGALAGHAQAELLRDFTFNTATGGTAPADALNVDLSGLTPSADYVVRIYSYDRNGNDRAASLWYDDPADLSFGGNEAFLSAHQNLVATPGTGFVDLHVTSKADGTIKLVSRGSGGVPSTGNITLLNGLEVFQPTAATDVIKVDMNNSNPAGGALDATEPGFVGLTLNDPGGQSGSVTDGGVTVSVSTDRDDTPTRHRNNTGESLVNDFVFANDELDVQIDGLTPGVEYEITVFARDTDSNNGQISRWLLAADERPPAMLDGRFPPAAITDGIVSEQHILNTTKHSDSYWLAPDAEPNAYVTVDLLGVYDISKFVLVNGPNALHGGTDSGTDAFEVYVSVDGETFGAPAATGNLPQDQTPQTIDGLALQGRYVRVKASSFFEKRAGLTELEVYGTLVESSPHNVAAGKTVSGPSLDGRFPPSAVVDGVIRDEIHVSDVPEVDSYWLLASGTTGAIDVDLGALHEISQFVLVPTINFRHSGSTNGDRGTEEFQILVSPDGINFAPVVDAALPDLRGPLPTNAIPSVFDIAPVQATHVRFQVDAYYGSGGGLNEWAVIGTPVGAPAPPAPAPGDEAVTSLKLDMNDDDSGETGAADTHFGFTPFTLNQNGSAVNGVTITFSPLGAAVLDDRDRGTPVETPTLTQDQLYDDFIFANGLVDGDGMEILMEGLEPNHQYRLTMWGFDSSSIGSRVADWVEASTGTSVPITTYTFDGSVTPVADGDDTFTALVTSSDSGQLQLQGRRSGGVSHGVFVNALQIDSLGYHTLIETDVEDTMLDDDDTDGNGSAWIRVPFNATGPFDFDDLRLRMKYDDGFVAYLNGVEVARANAPGAVDAPVAFDAVATAEHDDSAALLWQEFSIAGAVAHLVDGVNVLAIHGLNIDAADNDFLILPELIGTKTLGVTTRYFDPPTPGEPNGLGFVDFVADTRFSVDRGYFDQPFSVDITTATPSAEIYYSIDGSWPTPSDGTLYTGPIAVSETTTLRAAAFREGYLPTNTDTHTYIFLDDVLVQDGAGLPAAWGPKTADYEMDQDLIGPGGDYAATIKNDLATVPTLSIVMDVDDLWGAGGIYAHSLEHGRAWERATSVEYFDPNSTAEFQVDAGIRIHGGNGRNPNMPKHNLRLFFRNDYGPGRLDFPLFAGSNVESFDTLVLRARYGNSWVNHTEQRRLYSQYIREQWTRDTMRDMGHPSLQMSPVQVYLNGLYWGLFHIMERPDEAFAASHFGGQEDDYDVMHDGAAEHGDAIAFNAMLGVVNSGTLTPDEKFVQVQEYLDMDHFVDFTMMQIYGGNWDLNNHNWWATRRREPGGQFHFYPWDTEHIFQEINRDVSEFSYSRSPWTIHQALRSSLMYRTKFADHVQRAFFNGGLLTPEKVAERWMIRAAEIDRAVVGESVRWGDHRLDAAPDGWANGPYQVYTRDDHWIAEQNRLLTEYFPQRHDVALAQFAADGLFPDLAAPTLLLNDTPQHGGPASGGDLLSMIAPDDPVLVETTLLTAAATADYVVPLGDDADPVVPGDAPPWTAADFDPSTQSPWTWQSGDTGIGYDTGTTYDSLFGIDAPAAEAIRQQMRDDGNGDTEMNGSIFIRVPFTVDAGDLASFTQLVLRMKYDDGFVAYINGTEVHAANAPDAVDRAWDSLASASHGDTEAVVFEEFDISAHLGLLQVGTNVLAIHGMNVVLTSSDLLLLPELAGGFLQTNPGGPPIYFSTDGSDPRQDGGTIDPAATEFSSAVPLTESTLVKARTLQDGQWSPLTEATFVVGVTTLAVSEINYHPHDPTADELTQMPALQADDFEFIEIVNTGALSVGLTGVYLADGVVFQFAPDAPVTSLDSGQYTVIVKNPAAFELRYGLGLPIAGVFEGGLKNGGENVALANALDETIFAVDYDDSGDWSRRADGFGSTLELIDPAIDTNDPANWRASSEYGGTPAALGIGPRDDIVINEVLSNSDSPGLVDTIELLNRTGVPQPIDGWYLSDSNTYKKHRIEAGTTIAAGDYLLFDESQFNPAAPLPDQIPFALNGAGGDDVWLLEADAGGKLLSFVDHVDFGPAAANESFGRWPDGTGRLYPMTDRTLPGPNSGPRFGPIIVSEVMYQPTPPTPGELAIEPTLTADDFEFVELFNPTPQVVDVAHWRLDNAVDLFMPAGATLLPGQVLVAVSFDPADTSRLAAFQARYPAAPTEALIGPWSGRLNDLGETVQLEQPDPSYPNPLAAPFILADEVRYEPTSPWPVDAAGGGTSLARQQADAFGNDAASWANENPPTPGHTSLPVAPGVVQRRIFYSNSPLDANGPVVGPQDDAAIATDKSPLLPSQTASADNYISYGRGITGIMIDVVGLPNNGGDLLATDFVLATGNDSNPGGWLPGPAPTIDVRVDAGQGVADRVTLTWANDTIVNTWLQVTLRSTLTTGQPTDDVFYFGSAIGETGNDPSNALVTAADVIAIRDNPRGAGNRADVDNMHDINRDQHVDAADLLLARNHATSPFSALRLITPPLPSPAPIAAEGEAPPAPVIEHHIKAPDRRAIENVPAYPFVDLDDDLLDLLSADRA